jgi:hypothetical protein
MGVVELWLLNFRCVHVAQLGCAAASLWEGRLILRLNNFLRAPSIQESKSSSKQMTLPHIQEMLLRHFRYVRALMLLMQCVENYPEALWRGTPKLVTLFDTHAVEA